MKESQLMGQGYHNAKTHSEEDVSSPLPSSRVCTGVCLMHTDRGHGCQQSRRASLACPPVSRWHGHPGPCCTFLV